MRRKSTRKGTRNNNSMSFPLPPIQINTLIHDTEKPLNKENYLYEYLHIERVLKAKPFV